MSKKSILEQALLQVQDLEEAVKANAKGILASTMKEELNEVLKESMEEEVVEGNETPITEDEHDMPVSEQFDDEEGNDDEASINDEPADDEDPDQMDAELDDEGDDESDELSLDGDDDLELPAADDEEDDEDVLDMTNASDEEVLAVFKKMGDEDGIVVKRDGNNVELEDGDEEYIIKLDDEEGEVAEGHDEEAHEGGYDEEVSEEEDCQECGDSMEEEVSEEDDDSIYEIELEDVSEEVDEEVSEEVSEEMEEEVSEDDMEEEVSEEVSEEDDSHEEEVDEAARTKSNVHGDKGGMDRAGIKSKTKYKAGAINEEVETLKKQNAEYKKALVLFKEKLNEVAVFNANLAYATRLFTEHSTTRQEKLNILQRFDSVTSLTESKSTYKTIAGELGSKKNVTEAVVNKIASTPTTSSSQEVLSEAKAYESPQFKRMKDLMSKLK
jgi:hypothetical protein